MVEVEKAENVRERAKSLIFFSFLSSSSSSSWLSFAHSCFRSFSMRSSLSMQRQHAPCAVSASLAAWRPSPAIPRRPKANTTTTTTTLRNSPPTSTFPTTSSRPSQRLRVCSSSSSSSSGSIWDSEVVQKEFEVMMRDFADVSNCLVELRERERESSEEIEVRLHQLNLEPLSLLSKNENTTQMMKLQRGFPDFDLDGKEIYLDRVREECFFSFGSGERAGRFFSSVSFSRSPLSPSAPLLFSFSLFLSRLFPLPFPLSSCPPPPPPPPNHFRSTASQRGCASS